MTNKNLFLAVLLVPFGAALLPFGSQPKGEVVVEKLRQAFGVR